MDRKSFLNSWLPPSIGERRKETDIKDVNVVKGQSRKGASIQSGLTPYTGVWSENEVIHLLKRLCFGAVKEEVDYFKTLTVSQAVDELLNTKNTNIGQPLKNYTPNVATVPSNDPDWSIPIGRTWVNTPTGGGNNFARRASLQEWWMGLMINQPRSIEEKMILFLSTFTALEFTTVGNAIYCYNYLNTLRTFATGNYKSLIKAITLEPAMLVYLNGMYNTKSAPDENYGRELQELFTVGKGPDSHYTEDDVKAAARVLTGYRINSNGQTYFDTSNRHDTTNKTFSSFYNNTVITGRTGTDGQLELDDLLDMIFSTTEAAKFICRRIYRFFVYGSISSDVETNVITPMANTLRAANYELKPALSLLFKSEHFFDVQVQGALIKSPIDFVVGMARETKLKFPPTVNIPILYTMYGYMVTQASNMSQTIGNPPNVSGWQAYYLDPLYDEFWLNTDSYSKMVAHISVLQSGYTNTNQTLKLDWIGFAKRMSDPGDPNVLVKDFNTYFLRMALDQASLDTIKTQTLLSGQSSDAYWTTAWNNYTGNPYNAAYLSDVNNRLANLMKYFMNLEEYYLM